MSSSGPAHFIEITPHGQHLRAFIKRGRNGAGSLTSFPGVMTFLFPGWDCQVLPSSTVPDVPGHPPEAVCAGQGQLHGQGASAVAKGPVLRGPGSGFNALLLPS